MKILFHATVRDIAGISEIELSARTLAELMEALEARFGKRLKDMLVKDGRLRDDVVILVNGQNISHSKGLETELRPEDDIAIFPPVSGG
jgi:molybdopterin synthase sulfur carrier subunit